MSSGIAGRPAQNLTGFLKKAHDGLGLAGRKEVPLATFVFHRHTKPDGIHQVRSYTAWELATSRPFIQHAMARLLFSTPAGYDAIRAKWEADEHEDELPGLGHKVAEDLCELLRRHFPQGPKWPDPMSKEIPKPKPPAVAEPKDLLNACIKGIIPDTRPPEKQQEMRGLKVSSIEHRVAAAAAAGVLTAYTADILRDCAVAYRPGIGVTTALSALRAAIQVTNHATVLCTDITGFFDAVPRAKAVEALCRVTKSKPSDDFIRYVLGLLCWHDPADLDGVGLPQGSPLSPVLSNIFAHCFIDPNLQRMGPALRYADDIAICCADTDDALVILGKLQRTLCSHGMGVAVDKTVIVEPHRGVEHRVSPAPHGLEIVVPPQPIQTPYLGVLLGWNQKEAALEFRLADKALWGLTTGLIEAMDLRGKPHRGGRALAQVRYFERAIWRVEGWLTSYAGVKWTPKQRVAFLTILVGCALLPGRDPWDRFDIRAYFVAKDSDNRDDATDALRAEATAIHASKSAPYRINLEGPKAAPWIGLAEARPAILAALPGAPEQPVDYEQEPPTCSEVAAIITAAKPHLNHWFELYRQRFLRALQRKYCVTWNRGTASPRPEGTRAIRQRGRTIPMDTSERILPAAEIHPTTGFGPSQESGTRRWGSLTASATYGRQNSVHDGDGDDENDD